MNTCCQVEQHNVAAEPRCRSTETARQWKQSKHDIGTISNADASASGMLLKFCLMPKAWKNESACLIQGP